MYRDLHRNIRQWYAAHGRRDLPWRNTDDAYPIYLSEVMLQQTQVSTVLERYYFPFLKRFPTLEALGDAPLEAVLKAWEGLGYYNRAKNLHKTAQLTGGTLPESIEALMRLPGIGKNTAHAVAAFAFRQAVPVMEANVRRILARLYALEVPTEKQLWTLAYDLLDKENAFDYNQAMMDIGAMLCTPKAPKCDLCPLQSICHGKTDPERFPQKRTKTVPTKNITVLLYKQGEKLGLYKRDGKFLHGLWGFPECDTPPDSARPVGSVKHAYTHFKLSCEIYLVEEIPTPDTLHYFSVSEICKIPISKVDEKILKRYLHVAKDC